MTTTASVLMLLGPIVTAYGLWGVWCRNSDTPQKWRASLRQASATGKRWARLGRPTHHTVDAHVVVAPTMTASAAVPAPRVGTDTYALARMWREIDDLKGQNASDRAKDREHNAARIRQAFDDYRAEQRANTRRQTLIAGIGVALTITGSVVRLIGG